MTQAEKTPYVALLGDVIASRHAGERADLQKKLITALDQVNLDVRTEQRLMMTVGDEFQGLYGDLASGLRAAMLVQLRLLPGVEVRIGLGWGDLTMVADTPPFGQDGPCWWRAREAIERVKANQSANSTPKSRRVRCVTGTDIDDLANAYLGARDHIIDGLDEIDASITLMRINGASQVRISKAVGLSQSAVSRRLTGHGLIELLDGSPEVVPVTA